MFFVIGRDPDDNSMQAERKNKMSRSILKNTKKTAALFLAAAMIMMLAACAAGGQTSDVSGAGGADSSAVESESSVEGKDENADESGSGESMSLDGLLDDINANFEVGSAGSSLKAINFAAKLLDWCAGSGLTAGEARSAAEKWLEGKDDDAKATFGEQMAAICESCKELLGENADRLLSDAGCENTGYPWEGVSLDVIDGIAAAAGESVDE